MIRERRVMADFIELGRQFVAFDDASSEETESRFAGYLASPKGWAEVLAKPCTVVIAEAGNGKSSELRHQAETLIAQGRFAFLAPLDLLARMDELESSFELGTKEQFQAWKRGDAHAYFFLDA